MSKLFSRFNLKFTFIKNVYMSIYFFFIMKILTDFCKTVETGMDPRLSYVTLENLLTLCKHILGFEFQCNDQMFEETVKPNK